MKKSLLLGAAVLAFGMTANAQKVQNIPNAEYLQLSTADGWSTVDIKTMPEEGEPSPRTKQNDKVKDSAGNIEGFWQFDSMKHGDVAHLKLNNTQESCYVISFIAATKEDGVVLNFEILDEAGNVEWSDEYSVYNNGDWNGRFESTSVFIEDPLTVGEKTLNITFTRDDENATGNTVNVAKFKFEAREEISTASVDTYVEPGDEAGTVTLSPFANSYLQGSEVVVTASAKTGYRFNHWEINGEVSEETATSFTYTVDGRTEIVAYFDKLQMENKVPGYINLFTRAGLNGKIQTPGAGKNLKVDGETIEDSSNENYLGDYRDGQAEEFDLDVTKDGNYTLRLIYAIKEDKGNYNPNLHFVVYDKAEYKENPAEAKPEWEYTTTFGDNGQDLHVTGQWINFETANIQDVALTAGIKLLHIDFSEPTAKKYTVNLYKFGFGIGEDWGEEAGVNDIVLGEEAPVKAYNLQGIEVAPDTKGLIILSNGTKVLNK